MNRSTIRGLMIAGVVVFAAAASVAVAAVRKKAEPVAGEQYRGAPDAAVTIVEYVDYECGFCRKAEKTIAALLERYPGKVRIQLAHNPLPMHSNAALAAAAVVAAGEQGKQWEMHDRLMASRGIDRKVIDQHAAALGLDLGRFASSIDAARNAVGEDLERGAAAGVRGTPAFFINGQHIVGAQPIEAFARVIDAELAGTPLAVDSVEEQTGCEAEKQPEEGCGH